MNAITIKVSSQLDRRLSRAARAQHLSKSELVRRALLRYLENGEQKDFVSAADLAGDLIGCLDAGPGDLATNPKHMEGFGR
jgi:predicted transcriptional regulator